MISVQNRVPNPGQEGRVLITPETGAPFYATLAMADGATQPGTPWNRLTGNLLQADIRSYPIASGQTVTAGQVVDIADAPPTVGQYVPGTIQMQNVPVGGFITRTENGVPQYYLVVHQGLPSDMYDASCDGTWVLRLGIYEIGLWDADNSTVLPGADIFDTMSGILSLFDAETQAAIKTVKIPYCVGGGSSTVQSGANGLECQIFPLSAYELGATSAFDKYEAMPEDGAILDFFSPASRANIKRMAYSGETNINWWTRTQYADNSGLIYLSSTSSGVIGGNAPNTSNRGIRPSFIFDPSFEVDGYYVGYTETLTTTGTPSQAITLQSGSAGDVINVIFQGVAELASVTHGQQITSPGVQGFGAMDGWLSVFPYWMPGLKIATGSYTGNGAYGSGSPNTLACPGTPVMLIVSYSASSTYGKYPWMYGDTTGRSSLSGDGAYDYVFLSWNGNTVSWYSSTNASEQLNITSVPYTYTFFYT